MLLGKGAWLPAVWLGSFKKAVCFSNDSIQNSCQTKPDQETLKCKSFRIHTLLLATVTFSCYVKLTLNFTFFTQQSAFPN